MNNFTEQKHSRNEFGRTLQHFKPNICTLSLEQVRTVSQNMHTVTGTGKDCLPKHAQSLEQVRTVSQNMHTVTRTGKDCLPKQAHCQCNRQELNQIMFVPSFQLNAMNPKLKTTGHAPPPFLVFNDLQ